MGPSYAGLQPGSYAVALRKYPDKYVAWYLWKGV